MDAVNLDCMTDDELAAIEADHNSLRIRRYASLKRMAIQCRLDGAMEGALFWEAKCEAVYATLPASLRW